ncbi:MAG: DUF3298 domain-containing protein [Ignavibacteriaceae bacterium]|nr:DUF3298 domain-containing protein [Ignavibacteriaceae bacterium]
MKKFNLLAILFLGVILFFQACSDKKEVTTDTFDRELVKYSKVYSIKKDSSLVLDVQYLKYIDKKNATLYNNVNDSIYSFVAYCAGGDKNKSLDSIFAIQVAGYKEVVGIDAEYDHFWDIEITVNEQIDMHGVVSVEGNAYMNTGGAHPNTLVTLLSFDKKTGKIVTINDLIDPSKVEDFRKVVEKYFRLQNKLSATENLEEAGFWLTDNKFAIPEEFNLTSNGIRFYINTYDIAPYVMGAFEIDVPYNEIKDLLKSGSLAQPFIK